MIARMLPSLRRRQVTFLVGLALSCGSGCHGFAKKHEAKSIPQYGEIDASQPGELRKIALQPYAIEPPDELEIMVRPPFPDWSPPGSLTFPVQADGVVDLGFGGNVYVYGLTLAEAEERIAKHLNGLPQTPDTKPAPALPGFRPRGQRAEQVLLRDRDGHDPRARQAHGWRNGPRRDSAGRPATQQSTREGVPGPPASAGRS